MTLQNLNRENHPYHHHLRRRVEPTLVLFFVVVATLTRTKTMVHGFTLTNPLSPRTLVPTLSRRVPRPPYVTSVDNDMATSATGEAEAAELAQLTVKELRQRVRELPNTKRGTLSQLKRKQDFIDYLITAQGKEEQQHDDDKSEAMSTVVPFFLLDGDDNENEGAARQQREEIDEDIIYMITHDEFLLAVKDMLVDQYKQIEWKEVQTKARELLKSKAVQSLQHETVNILSSLASLAISNLEKVASGSDVKLREEYDDEETYQAAVHFLEEKRQQPLSSHATIMEETTSGHSGGTEVAASSYHTADEYISSKYDEELKDILKVTKEAEELVRASLNMPAPSSLHHEGDLQPMPPQSPPPLSVVKACEKDILEHVEHALEWPSRRFQHRRPMGIVKLANKAKNEFMSKLP
eukprot:scaffold2383_cov161-Amphora_coffeaeformis.AAC.25